MATIAGNELTLNQCVSKGVTKFWFTKMTKTSLVALFFSDMKKR
jgi:hypothetical protein